MGRTPGLIVAIFLGLLGVFFSMRLGFHSLKLSRRQASWPKRRQQIAASRRYFGLAIFLLVGIVAGYVIYINKININPFFLFTPTASSGLTATIVPSETHTNTPVVTSTPLPTDTPSLTSTPAQTYTPTKVPSWTSRPTDTHWPTWTPSRTFTASPTPTPSRTPTPVIVTLWPTQTPLPTDTRWTTPYPTQVPSPTDTRWPSPAPTVTP